MGKRMADCQVQSLAIMGTVSPQSPWSAPPWRLPFLPAVQEVSRTGEVGPCSPSLIYTVYGLVSRPSPGWVSHWSLALWTWMSSGQHRNPILTLVLSCILQYSSPQATVDIVCYQASSNAHILIPISPSVLCGYAQLVRTKKGGRSESYISFVLLSFSPRNDDIPDFHHSWYNLWLCLAEHLQPSSWHYRNLPSFLEEIWPTWTHKTSFNP